MYSKHQSIFKSLEVLGVGIALSYYLRVCLCVCVCVCLSDPDRWGLEHGDVRWHQVSGRSQQGHGLLYLLHRPHTFWQLYPPTAELTQHNTTYSSVCRLLCVYCMLFKQTPTCWISFNSVLRHSAQCVLGHRCGQFGQRTGADQGSLQSLF